MVDHVLPGKSCGPTSLFSALPGEDSLSSPLHSHSPEQKEPVPSWPLAIRECKSCIKAMLYLWGDSCGNEETQEHLQ